MLKELKIQMYLFWPESIQELFNIMGKEFCLLYCIKTKQTQVAISTPMVNFTAWVSRGRQNETVSQALAEIISNNSDKRGTLIVISWTAAQIKLLQFA